MIVSIKMELDKMARHHVNPNTGNSSVCKAAIKGCPFGGESGQENHYSTAEEASAAAEKLMKESYSAVKVAYRKKDSTHVSVMNRELKKRIIIEASESKNDLHPSVVAKVFSKDHDELIRRNVAQRFKSQKILREMSDDESAKVRLTVAKSTNNPAVLTALASDKDAFVRRAVIVNANTPVKAKKIALNPEDNISKTSNAPQDTKKSKNKDPKLVHKDIYEASLKYDIKSGTKAQEKVYEETATILSNIAGYEHSDMMSTKETKDYLDGLEKDPEAPKYISESVNLARKELGLI